MPRSAIRKTSTSDGRRGHTRRALFFGKAQPSEHSANRQKPSVCGAYARRTTLNRKSSATTSPSAGAPYRLGERSIRSRPPIVVLPTQLTPTIKTLIEARPRGRSRRAAREIGPQDALPARRSPVAHLRRQVAPLRGQWVVAQLGSCRAGRSCKLAGEAGLDGASGSRHFFHPRSFAFHGCPASVSFCSAVSACPRCSFASHLCAFFSFLRRALASMDRTTSGRSLPNRLK